MCSVIVHEICIKYIIFIFNFKEVFKIISISPDVWHPILAINAFQHKLNFTVL